MAERGRFYEPSGEVETKGIFLMILFGIIAAIVLGAIYGYVEVYISKIYFRLLFPILYGAAIGYLIALGARWGHVRNPRFTALIALLGGILAEYTGWIAWIHAATKQELLLFSPIPIISLAKEVLKVGTWGLHGVTVTGTYLCLFWIGEGVLIIGVSIITALAKNRDPFCERCKKWIDQHGYIFQLQYIEDMEKTKNDFLNDMSSIKNFKKKKAAGMLSGKDYTEIEIVQCPSCNDFTLLDMSSVKVTVDRKDREKEIKKKVIHHLVISPHFFEKIKNLPVEL